MEQAKQMYTGDCVGGPMDGQEGQSRYPKGFVLVDRAAVRAWVYEWYTGTETFRVCEHEGRPEDETKRWVAANGGDWDVRAWAGGNE